MGAVVTVYRLLRRLLVKLVEPLREDEDITHFTLAIPEAQTTTVDSVQGWNQRPPAVLRCPGCEAAMYQSSATTAIHCQECWRQFSEDEFSDHELVSMVCPRCETEMRYGTRHPRLFDIPEWATCPECQYHWDLDHWF